MRVTYSIAHTKNRVSPSSIDAIFVTLLLFSHPHQVVLISDLGGWRSGVIKKQKRTARLILMIP
jgi:hypothetical protein